MRRPRGATKKKGGTIMSEAMWKEEGDMGTQPMPTWTRYADAMNKFTRSATAFMEHVHLLTEAWTAYQEAMEAGAALRNRLDAGDQTLRSLMTQLEQVVRDHSGAPVLDRKRPELVKVEPTRVRNEDTGTGRMFP
jgi:hypothetical protein